MEKKCPSWRNRRVAGGLIIIAWVVFGLIGHDPWKPDEAYTWGLVNHILKSGDFVVPTLAGEPFMEKPPLYFISAAFSTQLFLPWLAPFDAARLVTGFYVALALFFLALSARELLGKNQGYFVVLMFISCFGGVIATHEMITDVALLAGMAIAFYGLTVTRRFILAGFWLGVGSGIAFMSKGLLGPGIIGVTALVLLLFPRWRTQAYFYTLLIALLVVLPWVLIWPYVLYLRSPALFTEWFWRNNWGRFFGFAHLGAQNQHAFYLRTLTWYALPAWPLALWAVWRRRQRFHQDPALQVSLTLFLVTLLVLSLSSENRELYTLPLLLPLSFLAAAELDSIKLKVASALKWLAIFIFGGLSSLLWIGWFALLTGKPAHIALFLQKLSPAYTAVFSLPLFLIALGFAALWLISVVCTWNGDVEQVLQQWAVGLTLVWVLLTTLWLPWLDAQKSYRSMVSAIQAHLPAHYNCISSQNLGEPQRALLDYFAHIQTKRVEIYGQASCDLFLMAQAPATTRHLEYPVSGHWQEVWQGHRPGDENELFILFKRLSPSSS